MTANESHDISVNRKFYILSMELFRVRTEKTKRPTSLVLNSTKKADNTLNIMDKKASTVEFWWEFLMKFYVNGIMSGYTNS